MAQANEAGFEVIRGRKRNENGYCDFLNKQIAVSPGIEGLQAVKTLIHELGHALLHSDEPPRSKEVAEVEVESVAFIFCDALGLDTGDYSFAYVARWSNGEAKTIRETSERVIECAKRILCSLEASGPPAPVTSGSRGPAPS